MVGVGMTDKVYFFEWTAMVLISQKTNIIVP